jgi:thiol-disulfide isomerase/thioredoxin
MKTKTIISVVLLLFIFTSVAYLVVKEVRLRSRSTPAEAELPAVAGPNESSLELTDSKVVVYYFYGTARCPTCRKFESYSSEAVREGFPKELSEGRLEWRMVNVEESGNEHFVSDYQLYSKSIVIVKKQDGKQTEWKNLKRIWELVRDKRVFMRYIQDEVGGYMGAD